MNNIRTLSVTFVAMFALTGAKGGCGGEYVPGDADGGSGTWDVGTVPTAKGADLPMTCEWLESNNCWKQMIAEVSACAPKEQGVLNADRTACEYDTDAELRFAGPLSKPSPGTTFVVATDHRVLAADGSACLTGKILGVGKAAYRTKTTTIVSESKTVTNYRVVCADGTSYANDVPGTCADFGARYLAKGVPTYVLGFQPEGDLRLEVGGGPGNVGSTLARCK
jgi:hypothetical protein